MFEDFESSQTSSKKKKTWKFTRKMDEIEMFMK